MTTFGEELATQVIKNPGFLKDVNALLAYQFAATAHNKNLSLDNLQIKRLSEASVILASSPIDSHNRTAFEVITILYDQFRNRFPGIGGVTKLICSRLGNTPAIDLLDSSSLDLPVSLDVESQTKILANTVTFGGEALTLTDFQHESLELLSNAISLSLSAPTSAGKSFLITHFVVRQFAENIKYNAVIIVPTRALIRQLVADFSNVFYNYSGNHKLFSEISLVTSSAEPETNIASKRLFVLTQERLQAILYNWKHRPTFNLLVVDESQKISDSKRGIILEDSISELISSQPKMQAVFLSPLASNPSFLFDLVSPASANQSLHTMVSPVAQHVYTVRTSGTSYAKLTVNRVFQGTEDFLLDIETNREMPKRKAERLAFIVKLLSNQTSSLVYSNGPAEAEKNALALAKDQPRKTSEAINQTVQSLKDFIHEKYYLIDCLEKGVGYHYGSMPDIARGSVEDLFKSEKISLIACTSTLLEGVNLPAKNIFIDNPKLGHEPMDDSSFWNLAGRAGRLMKDLSGNVFCINQDKWETPVSQRIKEYKIESSLNKTINNEYFVNFCKDLGPAMDFESFEQATNNITLRYMERGADNTKRFLEKRTTPKNAEVILSSVAILRGSIAIPLDVLKKNKSIDIRFQQRFLDYLAQMSEERLIRLIPRQPMSQQYYDYLSSRSK